MWSGRLGADQIKISADGQLVNRAKWAAILAFLTSLAATAAAAQTIKPLLHGVILMGPIAFRDQPGGIPDNDFPDAFAKPGAFDAVIINATWAQLQPAPNDFSSQSIDAALEKIRAYNREHAGSPLAAKLRVYAGPAAPEWVKGLGGPPVQIFDHDKPITIGRFWSEPYQVAWRKLQQELASRYDAEPLIHEVAMSSCSSLSAEPFIIAQNPRSQRAMLEAGFTAQQYEQCLQSAAQDYQPWKRTRVEFPFNQMPHMEREPGADPQFPIALMRTWRQEMGPRGIVANHSLQDPPSPKLLPIYDEMKRLGPPVEFQLFAPTGMDLGQAMNYGTAVGASAIEVWPIEGKQASVSDLHEWSNALKHNSSP
jgi:hypothetical protein